MALSTPTTKQVSDSIQAQIESAISVTAPLLPKAFVRVLARVLAGVFILVYKFAGWSFLQMFVSTAGFGEVVVNGYRIRPLVEWGRLVGVGDPLPATPAELLISVDAESIGAMLPVGSQLLHPASGITYRTTAAAKLDAPTRTVTVRADEAGPAGNLDTGDTLAFVAPIGGVARDATVVLLEVPGTTPEPEEVYRRRVIRRFQRRPQGGAYADYQHWGEGVASIARVFPYTGKPGVVDVYVEAMPTPANPDGIPSAAQLEAVEHAISFDVDGRATRKPATATVKAHPIRCLRFDVRLIGLAASDPGWVRQSISVAMDEFLRTRSPYIVGLSVGARCDRVTLAAVSGIVDETASAMGATVEAVELRLEFVPVPITTWTLTTGQVARLGEVALA